MIRSDIRHYRGVGDNQAARRQVRSW